MVEQIGVGASDPRGDCFKRYRLRTSLKQQGTGSLKCIVTRFFRGKAAAGY